MKHQHSEIIKLWVEDTSRELRILDPIRGWIKVDAQREPPQFLESNSYCLSLGNKTETFQIEIKIPNSLTSVENRAYVFIPNPTSTSSYEGIHFDDGSDKHAWLLRNGLIYATSEDAKKRAFSMRTTSVKEGDEWFESPAKKEGIIFSEWSSVIRSPKRGEP